MKDKMKNDKVIKIVALIAKALGLLEVTGATELFGPKWGIVVFMAASCLKDVLNRLTDFMDDGQINNSVKVGAIAMLGALIMLATSGCAFVRASSYNAETRTRDTITASFWFNKSAAKGLKSHYQTKTSKTMLGIEDANTETQSDAIKAAVEAAVSGAVKAAVKP